jgi:hypothetical protein
MPLSWLWLTFTGHLAWWMTKGFLYANFSELPSGKTQYKSKYCAMQLSFLKLFVSNSLFRNNDLFSLPRNENFHIQNINQNGL